MTILNNRNGINTAGDTDLWNRGDQYAAKTGWNVGNGWGNSCNNSGNNNRSYDSSFSAAVISACSDVGGITVHEIPSINDVDDSECLPMLDLYTGEYIYGSEPMMFL